MINFPGRLNHPKRSFLVTFWSILIFFAAQPRDGCALALSTNATESFQTNGSSHPLCAYLPEVSASYLWNSYLQVSEPNHEEVLFSSIDLRRGIRTRPKPVDWKYFMDLVHSRVSKSNAKSLKVAIVTRDNGSPGNTVDSFKKLILQIGSLLESLQEHKYLQFPHVPVEWYFHAGLNVDEDATFHALQQSSDKEALSWHDFDIVVNAVGLDIEPTATEVETPDFANGLRSEVQDWLRSLLLPPSCQNLEEQESKLVSLPLVFILDEYIGTGKGGALSDAIFTRTVQRLSDWYQLPMLSTAAVARPLLYQGVLSKVPDRFQLLSQLLIFALTDFSIDYCDGEVTAVPTGSMLLRDGVEDLVNFVIPPPLTPSLSLREVSRLWKEAEATQGVCVTQRRARAANSMLQSSA